MLFPEKESALTKHYIEYGDSDFQKTFGSARLTEVLIFFLVGIILFLVGLINFVNILVMKTILRQKELTIYGSLGMPAIVSSRNSWCTTYQYSLAPLWIALTALTGISLIIPDFCLRYITRDTITERLRSAD